MSKKRRQKFCYLCGQSNPDTKEHIPPRGIFPKKPKGQLITVPAHKDCNNRFSRDDELFRNLIIAASCRNRQARKAWDTQVVPSFKKNPGAKQELRKRLRPLWLKEKIINAYVRVYGLFVEVALFERQVDRWTRGLFYHRFKEPFPPNHKIKIIKWKPPEISIPPFNKLFAEEGFIPKWVHVEPRIFSYFYGVAKEDKYQGIAVYVFFDTEVFVGLTS